MYAEMSKESKFRLAKSLEPEVMGEDPSIKVDSVRKNQQIKRLSELKVPSYCIWLKWTNLYITPK